MKALIISDVHSNIDALRAVFAQEKDFDVVYCAGDIVDHGLDPCEAIDWLIEHNCHCVSGNHDIGVIKESKITPVGTPPPTPYSWKEYTLSLLSERHLQYLKDLEEMLFFEIDGISYMMIHSYTNDYQIINHLPAFERFVKSKAPSGFDVERIILGHTHLRAVHYLHDKKLWLNPGSISYRHSRESTKGAHYIVIEDGEIFLKHIDYDRSELEFRRSQLTIR